MPTEHSPTRNSPTRNSPTRNSSAQNSSAQNSSGRYSSGGRSRRLRVTILDLVASKPKLSLSSKVMKPNFAAIMPQAIATWCEQLGHEVTYNCYIGGQGLIEGLGDEADLVFISAFTRSALTAYALAAMLRAKGVITVLGGPHARCYPEDSAKYFDYVLGLTDKTLIEDLLKDPAPRTTEGVCLNAAAQPGEIPGVRERWKFIEPTLAKAPFFQLVPMIGSTGCPYTCSFCIDSVMKYQPLGYDQIKEDLRFLAGKRRRPRVGWHDPNFGIRFDDYMTVIEESVRPGSIDFVAESSLSLLSEPNLKRMKDNGFKGMLPGIESWFDCGGKSKTGGQVGREKVKQVADHINLIMEYIPYLQANFVFGLDCDEGPEPFELTKEFVDRAPGAFPAYSVLTAFGRAAPLNLELQNAGRVTPVPFHFLNNHSVMNVVPDNYAWPDFYESLIDLTEYTFSPRMNSRRFMANKGPIPRMLNLVRGTSSEGSGRTKHNNRLLDLMKTEPGFVGYLNGESETLPSFFMEKMRRDLGPVWDWLPAGAHLHDQNAYSRIDRAAAE